MQRYKQYTGGKLSVQGWRLLIALSEKLFGTPNNISATVYKDSGGWGYEALEDFLADVVADQSIVWIYFKNGPTLHLSHQGLFQWELQTATKAQIMAFERDADSIVHENWLSKPSEPKEPQAVDAPPTVFIGHGRAPDWRDLKDHLQDKHGIRVEAYETGTRAGHTIRDILQEMLDGSSLAILVHTPEDEMADGTFSSRPNVIHETGLFQGKLGFSKAVVVRKKETAEFSNLAGIQEIRYGNTINEAFGEILAWIRRETLGGNVSRSYPKTGFH